MLCNKTAINVSKKLKCIRIRYLNKRGKGKNLYMNYTFSYFYGKKKQKSKRRISKKKRLF